MNAPKTRQVAKSVRWISFENVPFMFKKNLSEKMVNDAFLGFGKKQKALSQ
jgi:hypothetical protein